MNPSPARQKRMEHVMRWYAPARFGLFYHYGLFTGGGNAVSGNPDWARPLRHRTVEEFEAAAPDPALVARNLARTATDAGARYTILTVCHTCGGQVVLYPTAVPGFLHKTTKDYIGPYLEEARAAGLHPMLYLPGDCHNWDNPQTGPNVAKEAGRDPVRFAELLTRLVEEIKERYGDLPEGFWMDGGVPESVIGVHRRIRELWPDTVIVGNAASPLNVEAVDYGTSEFTEPGVALDPPYDRTSGLLRGPDALGWALPRRDFNEDIPAPNDWWYQGDGTTHPEYTGDPFFLLRQMLCSLGRRGLWNFAPGIGPRIDGTAPDELLPSLHAIRDFLAWAGEAVYNTRGPAGTIMDAGFLNAWSGRGFCAVTNRLDAPNVFYVFLLSAPRRNGACVLETSGHEPRRITDLRTGADIPFRMWAGPVVEGFDASDIDRYGATVLKLEF